MLNALAIDLLCDSRTVDAAGNVITIDRSRHGIHPYLGPDGQVAGQMPTLDSLNGRLMFDGNDFILFPQAKDVDAVIEGMGGDHAETYMFLFDPFISNPSAFQTLLLKGDDTLATSWVRIRQRNTNDLEFRVTTVAGNEIIASSIPAVTGNHGKKVLFSFVRDAGVQEIWVWDVLDAADNDPTRDASLASACAIGSSLFTGSTYLVNGNGLRAFFYGRFRATQIWLRALIRYLEGNL